MEKKIIGHCGVDSGQLLIIDPCYLGEWKDGEVDFDTKDFQNDYDEASKLTVDNDKQGGQHSKGGVVFNSGLGDGEYQVEAIYSNVGEFGKRIKEIRIKFF